MELLNKHDAVHVFAIRAFLDDSREVLGREKLDALLAEFGVTPEEMEDPSAWIRLELFEGLLNRLFEVRKDPALIERCGRKGLSLHYLGPLMPLLSTFGSPVYTYQWLAKELPRFNKRMQCKWERTGKTSGRISFVNFPDAPKETTTLPCQVRRVQMATIPTLYNLPPAQVEHPKCIARGADACVYEVKWQERSRKIWSRTGILLGVVAALELAWGTGSGSWAALALALALGMSLWALGRVYELKGELADRVKELAEHNDALAHIAKSNEDRFAELVEAKAEVDRKVDERTTELRETSERLSETLARVEALSRAKTEFFSNVSHDLRTPLTLLAGPLDEMVAGREPPGGTKAAIDAMHRNTKRLLGLINQLLDLSKFDAGKMELHRAPVNLGELAENVLQAFRPAAQTKQISLTLQVPGNMAVCALDPAWIESIFANLVSNALRFVGEGGLIAVCISDLGSEIKIAVEDNGSGISAAELPHIFERFAQAGQYRARRGGTGIGLALVREAARLHGGEVSVKSELGKSTLFEISLPRVSCDALSLAPVLSMRATDVSGRTSELLTESSQDAGEANRTGPTLDAPLVLVVEDHSDTRQFVADVLAAQYRVQAAADGAQGLAMAFELRPDAIVSDVDMPEMDGLTLCRALRGDERTRTTPILLLTAMGDPSSVMAGFHAGADDYLPKPFHGRELLARIGVHIRLRQLVGEIAHKERLAILGVTAASVAHQVRNPLNAILSGLQGIRKRYPDIDPASREMIDVMTECGHRIEEITNDLMNVSRLDRAVQGRWRAADGLSTCVRLIKSRAPTGVDLNFSVEEDAEIEGRPGDLNQVFLNLLDNALRAVGDHGRIDVTAERGDGALVVMVADSGPGVEPGMEDRIFSPFVTTRTAGEGTGLGLSISKQVVEQHGGEISVSRSDLGGAVFCVRIPIVKPKAS